MSEPVPALPPPAPDAPALAVVPAPAPETPGHHGGDVHGGLAHLTEEQVQTWSLEQKDRWWLENVYRGDMPQLTLRSGLTGMILGGVLVVPNLYIGAKTGWTLGFGVTSVIMSFCIFKVFAFIGRAAPPVARRLIGWVVAAVFVAGLTVALQAAGLTQRFVPIPWLGPATLAVLIAAAMSRYVRADDFFAEMTLLENNAMQSIATAAGYMTGTLIASLAAYMMFTNTVLPQSTVLLWSVSLSVLGVLFAFPLKKRFINDEQLPFPEGRAAGVVMHSLHTGGEKDGVFQGMLLLVTGVFGALTSIFKSELIVDWFRNRWLNLTGLFPFNFQIPDTVDGWIYDALAKKDALGHVLRDASGKIQYWFEPAIRGTQLRNISVAFETDFVMIAAGGLMGIRTGVSILAGAVVNYFVLVPWMIERGDIVGKIHAGAATTYSLKDITFWSLWGGVSLMTTSSLFGFFSKPKVIISAVSGLFKKRAASSDVLKDIELPMSVFAIGIPLVGAIVVFLANAFFGVTVWMGILAIPLVFIFTLIAVNSTGLTSITPTGSLGKLTQLTYSAIAPGNVTTNLMTAGITAEVASNASNLLMDIKPGYMLGGKPRHQAIGHVLGIVAGACVAVPMFYLLFLQHGPQEIVNASHPMPGAVQWQAVATVLSKGLSNLKPSAQLAALIGAIMGIVLEAIKTVTKGRFWFSAVGFGLAFVLPFGNCFTMFLGAFIFWAAEKLVTKKDTILHKVMVQNQEATCAGVVAGGGFMGVIVQMIETFALS